MGLPVCILALAAGVYLLLQVKHYGFGTLYKGLAWLVILLSLVCISFCATRGAMHMRHMHDCKQMSGHCEMGSDMGTCPHMNGPHGIKGECTMGGYGYTDSAKPACCQKSAATIADSSAHK